MKITNPYSEDSEEYKYVQKAIELLKNTKSGLNLYNQLNSLKEEITIPVGVAVDDQVASGKTLGQLEPTADNELDGSTITLDKVDIENVAGPKDSPYMGVDYISAYGVLGHELEHAKQLHDNREEFINAGNISPYVYEKDPREIGAFKRQATIEHEREKMIQSLYNNKLSFP